MKKCHWAPLALGLAVMVASGCASDAPTEPPLVASPDSGSAQPIPALVTISEVAGDPWLLDLIRQVEQGGVGAPLATALGEAARHARDGDTSATAGALAAAHRTVELYGTRAGLTPDDAIALDVIKVMLDAADRRLPGQEAALSNAGQSQR